MRTYAYCPLRDGACMMACVMNHGGCLLSKALHALATLREIDHEEMRGVRDAIDTTDSRLRIDADIQ